MPDAAASRRPERRLGLVEAIGYPAVRGRALAPRPGALLRPPSGAADWPGRPNVRLPIPTPAF